LDAIKQLRLVFLLGFCQLASAQGEGSARGEDAILWHPQTRLAWSDFRAEPPESRRIAATTASGITYSYNATGSGERYSLDFRVDTYFYPDKSWYHSESCDEVVLSHEQLHFDISELFARKFRKRLKEGVFTGNVKAEVRRIFTDINRELSEFQNRYDRETDYSRNRAAQFRWNEDIAGMLAGPDTP